MGEFLNNIISITANILLGIPGESVEHILFRLALAFSVAKKSIAAKLR